MLKIDEKLMEKYLDRECVDKRSRNWWEKFLRESTAWLVELEDGTIYRIEREKIETDFCYGESGYDADDAYRAVERAYTSLDHFKRANLRGIDEKIRLLGEKTETVYGINGAYSVFEDLYINPSATVVDSFYTRRYWSYADDNHKKIGDADRKRILDGYKLVRDDFEKRIDRYLKRYGLSKVRAWTYWRDA